MNVEDESPRSALPEATATEAWQTLVLSLDLQPHPEGGHYRETFRSALTVQFRGRERCAGTSIYYLLAQGAYSAWHRIDADELWYFHAGAPLALHVIEPSGRMVTHRLGDPLRHPGVVLQAVVPAGHWFSAELSDPTTFCLVACAVTPGFEFAGFKLAEEADLAEAVKRNGPDVLRLLRR